MVKATVNKAHYTCALTNGTHNLTADEPVEFGGADQGFAPKSLLMASLASCIAITLRMYIDRKGWPVDKIEVEVNMDTENGNTIFYEEITCSGKLSPEQKKHLESIAGKCPVSKVLSAGNIIKSKVL